MDKAAFVEYWNESVHALIYDVHQMRAPITAAAVNKLWRKELLDNRFFSTGIRHGAAAWLENAEKEDAQKGLALRSALNRSALDVGLIASKAGLGVGGAAAVAGGGWALSRLNGSGRLGGLIASAAGLGLMAKFGRDMYAASNADKICEEIEKAAKKKLAEITALF